MPKSECPKGMTLAFRMILRLLLSKWLLSTSRFTSQAFHVPNARAGAADGKKESGR